jgi:hypothetical protein
MEPEGDLWAFTGNTMGMVKIRSNKTPGNVSKREKMLEIRRNAQVNAGMRWREHFNCWEELSERDR